MAVVKLVDGGWRDLAKAAHYRVGTYARLCRLSTRSLRRLFLHEQGRSPKNALDAARLMDAQEFLLAREPAKKFATELGFKHPTDFSAWFAHAAGTSPSQFIADHSARLLPPGALPREHISTD